MRTMMALLVIVAFGSCARDPVETAGDAGGGGVLSAEGESCTKTADCAAGLKCVNLVCVPGNAITIDNRDTDCSSGSAPCVQQSGEWETGGPDDGTGPYGGDFLFHEATESPDHWVKFLPMLPEERDMQVRLFWSAHPNRTDGQPVVVRDAEGKDHKVEVDLREPPPTGWFVVGTFRLGPKSFVEVNTDTSLDPDGNHYCNADAVRLLPAGE